MILLRAITKKRTTTEMYVLPQSNSLTFFSNCGCLLHTLYYCEYYHFFHRLTLNLLATVHCHHHATLVSKQTAHNHTQKHYL